MPITTCHLKVLLNCLTISFTWNSNTGKYYSVAYICFKLLYRQRQKIRSRIKTSTYCPSWLQERELTRMSFPHFLVFQQFTSAWSTFSLPEPATLWSAQRLPIRSPWYVRRMRMRWLCRKWSNCHPQVLTARNLVGRDVLGIVFRLFSSELQPRKSVVNACTEEPEAWLLLTLCKIYLDFVYFLTSAGLH